jgi:CHAT domain-containing protein/Tfp pilus assembly protein PilF
MKMHRKRNRVKIVFSLILFFGVIVFAQDKPVNVNENKQLREKILAVYQAGGKQGLRDFVQKNKDHISNKFIKDFAKAGKKESKEEWLKACQIIAEEKKEKKTLADVLYNTGEYFNWISENKKATDYYDRALFFYQKLNDLVGQGNVYWGKGRIYLNSGDYFRALEMIDKSLPFYEKAGHPIGLGDLYLGKGVIYFYSGDNSRALEMYDKALLFYEKAGYTVGLGKVYFRKGDIYANIGDDSKALEMYDNALPFFKKAGYIIGLGYVYLGKGDIYFYTGDNSRALKMYDKALPFFEKASDPISQGNVYVNKGKIYSTIGDNLRALEMYEKALPLFEKASTPIGQGNVYLLKGSIYSSIGDDSRALEMIDKALLFFVKAREPGGQGSVYLLKGIIYAHAGDNSRALEMYNKALPFYEKVGTPIGQGTVYYKKGVIYSRIGDNSRALEMYEKALLFYKKKRDIQSESKVLHGKAKILVKLGKKYEALALFEKSIANLEKVRTQTAFSEMKQTFMEMAYRQYEETVLFMLKNKHYEKGFKYAESMRTRVFLDRMAEGLVRLDKGLPPDLEEKRDHLVTKLSRLSTEMHKTGGKKEKEKLTALEKQYRETEREFQELLVKIRITNPLYASVRYPRPVSVQTLQKTVLKENELLLRYFNSPAKLYVFVITPESFEVVPIAVNQKELKGTIKRYSLALDENNSRDIKRYGQILYRKLVKPLDKVIKKDRDIIIIPDEDLVKVPFETLIVDHDNKKTGPPVFLLEKYRINYIQSASLLWFLRKHYSNTGKIAAKGFIGFGDPVYDYENFKQGKPEQGTLLRSASRGKGNIAREIHRSRYFRAGGIMDRLPQSGEEVRSIARLFQKEARKWAVHSREQASEATAKAPEMKDFDYIHFACHGLLNDTFQSLVLSQLPPSQSPEDGYFTLTEIMNCDWNARLIVLSACQTGSGKLHKGEGVTGLTRAVMYAGTPTVVASLWKVDDEATKELMVRFYKNMLEKNLDKAEALRQAKLELLKNKKYASPLFWGAFVMYGE